MDLTIGSSGGIMADSFNIGDKVKQIFYEDGRMFHGVGIIVDSVIRLDVEFPAGGTYDEGGNPMYLSTPKCWNISASKLIRAVEDTDDGLDNWV